MKGDKAPRLSFITWYLLKVESDSVFVLSLFSRQLSWFSLGPIYLNAFWPPFQLLPRLNYPRRGAGESPPKVAVAGKCPLSSHLLSLCPTDRPPYHPRWSPIYPFLLFPFLYFEQPLPLPSTHHSPSSSAQSPWIFPDTI